MFNKFNLILLLLVSIGVGILTYGYNSIKHKLEVAENNLMVLNSVIAEQQNTITVMRIDFEKNSQILQHLNSVSKDQQSDIREMRERFSQSSATGRPRDISNIARTRPESVQRVINNASRDAARCIELASGDPHTQAELDATKPSEINSTCPRLANPNWRE
jgi:hypothetical protein